MKITDVVDIDGTNLQKSDKAKGKASGASGGNIREGGEAVSTGDQVTISDTAKKIGSLQAEVMKLPEVRTGQVEELKSAVNSGTYNVKGEDVAGKLLKDTIFEQSRLKK
ncbi:MAG: flagellar biosynthesis anti-sigma factor FlgM [Nitrospirae bacterium]|nr:flagellar biosynthesis anti-sigma factor FlgM [Nitrospirota bacterium]